MRTERLTETKEERGRRGGRKRVIGMNFYTTILFIKSHIHFFINQRFAEEYYFLQYRLTLTIIITAI